MTTKTVVLRRVTTEKGSRKPRENWGLIGCRSGGGHSGCAGPVLSNILKIRQSFRCFRELWLKHWGCFVLRHGVVCHVIFRIKVLITQWLFTRITKISTLSSVKVHGRYERSYALKQLIRVLCADTALRFNVVTRTMTA